MNGKEIRIKISENNVKIYNALNTFILNPEIKALMKENDDLRKICQHHFVDGICEYCDAYENEVNADD